MRISILIFALYSTLFFGCKKFVETPKETCFIPYVDFVAHQVDPSSLTVTFQSVTSYNGTITSHKWDFGDGTSFAGETPPPHQYPPPGSGTPNNRYRVRYTVANECGEAFWTQDITVSACLPVTKFSYTYLNDSTVSITNLSTSPSPATYLWNFGDGTTSSSSAPTITKTFNQDQNFTVSLKATNNCGDNFFTASIPVCRQVIPSQIISQSGCATVNINASATKNGGRYQWNFGNGVILPATPSANFSITYNYPSGGTYTITLTVINQSGCDTATVTGNVTVTGSNLVPNNNWSYTSDDLDFNFSREAVVNATSYSWNFGDNNTSAVQNPGNKTYVNPGVYTISLGAGNACGNHNFTSVINVPFYRTMNNLPNTGFQQVIAFSPQLIYFLGTNGKLYKTDTTGNWSAAINLPSAISFNSDTKLYRDPNNNLWIFGKNEIAKFNPSNSTWTSSFSSTGFSGNTTINAIAFDNNGTLWSIDERQIRKGNNVISSPTNNQWSSIVYASSNNRMWITSSNRDNLYYVNVNSTTLNTQNISGIVGGSENMKVNSNGELFFSTGTGIIRASNSGSLISNYNFSNTNSALAGAPKEFDFDNEGNIWVIYSGKLLKIPIASSGNTKVYSFTSELNNLVSLDILNLAGTDNDIILAKNTGNVAIKIK